MDQEKKVKIPENIKKKLDRKKKLVEKFKQDKEKNKKINQDNKKTWIERAKKYAEEYAQQEKEEIQNQRKAQEGKELYIPEQPKVALAVRIRGTQKVNPKVKKILRLFRLRQINNATFIKVNKATCNMLNKVLPFLVLGYPTRFTIEHLIYKRGYGKIKGSRIPLSDNKIISSVLGKYGIICIQDLIHEIVTCGAHFKEANNFLWPFKLNNPRGGFVSKKDPYHNRGDWGNRESEINDYIKTCL